jgi:hypothetical protein
MENPMHEPTQHPATGGDSDQARDAYVIGRVREALQGMRFGEVRIVVHDGIVVQVERTEKLRLLRTKPNT